MNNGRVSSIFKKIPTVVYIIIVLAIAMGILVDNIFSATSLVNILYSSTITGLVAIGMAMIMILGELDLSSYGVVPLGGIICAKLMLESNLPILPAMLVTLLITAAFGALSGYLVYLLKCSPIIITFAVQAITCSLSLVLSNAESINGFSQEFLSIGKGKLIGIPYIVWIMLALMLIMWFIMRYTKFGCNIYSVGGNAHAAYLEGINVPVTKVAVYAIAAALAGLAGILYASRNYAALPISGTQHPFNAITACVIGGISFHGGKGNIVFSVVGAIVVSAVKAALSMLGANAAWQMFATGAIVAIALSIPAVQEILKERSEKRSRMNALNDNVSAES